ncbi:DUF2878 domain-containing protein [Erwinia aphidicola]|uniref:DUF2878 domain-containing protein n=1 Tax=Erwinia aphidicola TaxID=68334 RepID=UPI003CFA676C
MNRWRFWLLTLGFDVYWGLAVALRERIWLALSAVALLAWLLCPREVKVRLLLVAAGGVALDSLWLWSGLFSFGGSAFFPLWMLALWLVFACWWWLLQQRFALRSPLLALVGALGGPFAYFFGERLGAMQLHQPALLVFGVLAVGWAIYLPLVGLCLGYGKYPPRTDRKR